MTKEEALIKVKENLWFLRDHPEWNSDKEIVLTAMKIWGVVLEYASSELKNDKEIVMAAVKESRYAFQFASDELRKDKEFILQVVAISTYACEFSLLEGYKNFNEVIEKEGDGFLFSCWNNKVGSIRIRVANHPNFLPTAEQMEVGLKDSNDNVKNIYKFDKMNGWLKWKKIN